MVIARNVERCGNDGKDEEPIDKGSKHQMHESRVDSRPTFSKGQGIFANPPFQTRNSRGVI
ncbi:MAG: hypothetical protein DME98_07850 [Verrucomicrobia bacterium]|nr:MAG: hypothetical protein DME98_07850 [Verrucomicrobiota bacterium]PYJ35862.1 MAG: hypothetical protein DME88_00860 [Verrucomicrobiota bacterium]